MILFEPMGHALLIGGAQFQQVNFRAARVQSPKPIDAMACDALHGSDSTLALQAAGVAGEDLCVLDFLAGVCSNGDSAAPVNAAKGVFCAHMNAAPQASGFSYCLATGRGALSG
jgi:hypothetical protein